MKCGRENKKIPGKVKKDSMAWKKIMKCGRENKKIPWPEKKNEIVVVWTDWS